MWSDRTLLVDAMRDCKIVELNEKETHAKAQGPTQPERTTLILREISDDTLEKDVRAIFNNDECAPVKSMHPDIGNTWFVSFESEEDCIRTAMYLQNAGKFKGNPVHCRVKSAAISNVIRPRPRQPPPNRGGYGAPNFGGMGGPLFGGRGPPLAYGRPPAGFQRGFVPAAYGVRGPGPRPAQFQQRRRPERTAPVDNKPPSRSRGGGGGGGPNVRQRGQGQARTKAKTKDEGRAPPFPANYKHYTSMQIAEVIKKMITEGVKRPQSMKNAPKDILRKQPLTSLRIKTQ